MTAKEHTLKMLDYYTRKIIADEITPEIIIVRTDGAGNWCGISRERKVEMLQAEIDRMLAFV